jgi:DNA repair photolyase
MFHCNGMDAERRETKSESAILPGQRLRARGATDNLAGRFESHCRIAADDGWDLPEEERLIRTEVRIEAPRSALSYNRSPDISFDRSVNPYRGCEHGCIYCFARPTHAWLNLSPGLDFETRLIARPGIAAVLARELRAPSYRLAPIAIGTNTDPYQPCEQQYGVMRELLELLAACRHPVSITTKGTLIERDLDLLAPMAAQGLVKVGISLASLDPEIARGMEPRAPAPRRRLETMRRLAQAGVPVGVMVAPVVPGLTDPEIEAILAAARDAGARKAGWIMLRLPLEVSELFRDWLVAKFPARADKVMARLRELHGGRDYDPQWSRRMRGRGVWSDLTGQRFRAAVARLGINGPWPALREDLFVPPRAVSGAAAPRASASKSVSSSTAGDQLTLF